MADGWKTVDGGEWTWGCGQTKAGCLMCHGHGGWRSAFGWAECPCSQKFAVPKAYADAVRKTKQPYKHCQMCGGKGGARVNGRWIKCECTKTTPAERKLRKQMNEIGVRHPSRQQTLFK